MDLNKNIGGLAYPAFVGLVLVYSFLLYFVVIVFLVVVTLDVVTVLLVVSTLPITTSNPLTLDIHSGRKSSCLAVFGALASTKFSRRSLFGRRVTSSWIKHRIIIISIQRTRVSNKRTLRVSVMPGSGNLHAKVANQKRPYS